jgi:ribosomally synthesized peptide (two-chain TOMM family)
MQREPDASPPPEISRSSEELKEETEEMYNVDPGIEYSQFIVWGNAWLQSIALAWSKDELKKQLLLDPAKFLYDHLGYTVPKGLRLMVVEVQSLKRVYDFMNQLEKLPSAEASAMIEQFRLADVELAKSVVAFDLRYFDAPGTEGWNVYDKTWSLPKNTLFMILPPAPDVTEQAVALAAYAGSGRSYPFTTC